MTSAPVTLESFANISDSMYWKDNALHQLEEFRELSRNLGMAFDVVGHHTSKSIRLPVVRAQEGGVRFFLRDNFYDINVCVMGCFPFEFPCAELLAGICPEHDWAWYLNEIERCRGYTWKFFSDEEMEDPRILRVRPPGSEHWYSIDPDRKDRWLRRMIDPEWWSEDWAGGTITTDDPFGPGARLFVQSRPYLEGIANHSDVQINPQATKPYRKGCSAFALAVANTTAAEALIRKIAGK